MHNGSAQPKVPPSLSFYRISPIKYNRLSETNQRKWFENELIDSERIYLSFIKQTVDGVVILHDLICKFANLAMEKISGYKIEELEGMSFLEIVVPEYRGKIIKECNIQLINWGKIKDI